MQSTPSPLLMVSQSGTLHILLLRCVLHNPRAMAGLMHPSTKHAGFTFVSCLLHNPRAWTPVVQPSTEHNFFLESCFQQYPRTTALVLQPICAQMTFGPCFWHNPDFFDLLVQPSIVHGLRC